MVRCVHRHGHVLGDHEPDAERDGDLQAIECGRLAQLTARVQYAQPSHDLVSRDPAKAGGNQGRSRRPEHKEAQSYAKFAGSGLFLGLTVQCVRVAAECAEERGSLTPILRLPVMTA